MLLEKLVKFELKVVREVKQNEQPVLKVRSQTKLNVDDCKKKKKLERMEGKKNASMQRNEGANVKNAQMIIRSKIRAMGAEVKPASTEGATVPTLEDKQTTHTGVDTQ